jgi:hypothetical protein
VCTLPHNHQAPGASPAPRPPCVTLRLQPDDGRPLRRRASAPSAANTRPRPRPRPRLQLHYVCAWPHAASHQWQHLEEEFAPGVVLFHVALEGLLTGQLVAVQEEMGQGSELPERGRDAA